MVKLIRNPSMRGIPARYCVTREGDMVAIDKTSHPAGTRYHHASWWAYTVGRLPDIEIAGPCRTRRELIQALEAASA